jgi:outer membrane protein TolC
MNRICQFVLLSIIIFALTATGFTQDKKDIESQFEISLDNCLTMALQNSSEIKSETQQVKIAEEQLRQAQGGLWPTLGYEITGANSDQNQVGWLSLYTHTDTRKLSSASIRLTQPIYTGGQLSNAVKLAKLNLETIREDERKARQTLIHNVKAAYYQVWLAQQMVEVAEDSYENMGRHVERVRSFYEVGKASKFDLLRAEVQHENLKPSVIKAQNGVVLAKMNLSNLIGMEKGRKYRVNIDLNSLQLPKEVGLDFQILAEQAYQQRPEFKKLEKLQGMAKAKTAIAYAGYKPTVALVGTYQGSSVGDYNPGNWNDNKQWTLVLDIKGNFFDGFVTPAKVGEAKANQNLVEINEQKLRDGIDLEVEQSLQNLKESLETIFANQASIQLAKESLEMTEAKFEARMATTMDIRDSQLALDQALSGYYQGVAAYLTALAKLDLAIGKE